MYCVQALVYWISKLMEKIFKKLKIKCTNFFYKNNSNLQTSRQIVVTKNESHTHVKVVIKPYITVYKYIKTSQKKYNKEKEASSICKYIYLHILDASSNRTLTAAAANRKREAKFHCPICSDSQTSKQNLQSALLFLMYGRSAWFLY